MKKSRSGAGSRWWGWVVAAAGAAVVLAGVAAWGLVDPLSVSEPKERAGAIQAAFTIAFGFGGLATLGLFTRRQWHQERVHEHERQVAADARRDSERAYEHQRRVADEARHDAEQRRITEQYMKAVEQLGHEKAPVRLGGLYALDRLGRNHPEQRQVIAEVWCAYLRRRYEPPAAILEEETSRGTSAAEDADGASGRAEGADAEAIDEYEVRMTAQRLLIAHLKDPRPKAERDEARPEETEEYWHLDQVDLTGATLVEANFRGCRLPKLKADHARFHRLTWFIGVYFEGDALFGGARFEGNAWFTDARFERHVWFSRARFKEHTGFSKVRFGGEAWYDRALFESSAWFDEARFSGDAVFMNARFEDDTWFSSARFGDGAGFVGARFEGVAGFGGALFEGGVWFDGARFGTAVGFRGARFKGSASFTNLASGEAGDEPVGPPRIEMRDVVVERIDSEGRAHVWPPGWEPVREGEAWRMARVGA